MSGLGLAQLSQASPAFTIFFDEDLMAVSGAAFLRGTRLRSFLTTGRICAYIPPCAAELPTGA